MLFIENPTTISFNLDGGLIEGTVTGTPIDWEFISNNTVFKKIVGGDTLHKVGLKCPPHLLELHNIITMEIENLLG